jgi:hypothetical protein
MSQNVSAELERQYGPWTPVLTDIISFTVSLVAAGSTGKL